MNEPTPARQPTGRHPVSVASGGDIACPSCHRANRTNCQFCSACGQSLWSECPSCGSSCAASEAFCSVCGVNRAATIEQQAAEIKEALNQSDELAAKHEYDRAMGILLSVSEPKHANLDALAQQVHDRIAHLKEDKQRAQAAAGAAVAKARDLMRCHAYRDVIELLDQTPVPFRTADDTELRDLARTRDDELAALIDEIREAAATNRYLDLAPAVDQLLTLQPEHRLGQRLGEQLRERFCRKAQKLLAEFRYDEALQLLRAIPTLARNHASDQLAEQIGEVVWLFDDIRQAPVISPSVVTLARRLVKAVPGDHKAAAIRDKVEQLASQPSSKKRFGYAKWAPAAESPALGCPTGWLMGLRAFETITPEALAALKQQPGRYYVALGLALQALDASEIKIQLRQPEKQSVFGKLSVGQRKQPVAAAWGIDVGEYALKAIRLTRSPIDGTVAIDVAMLIEHDNLAHPARVVDQQHTTVGATLAEFCNRATIEKTDKICANLHSQKVLGRFLQLPVTTPKKLAELVKFESDNAIPCPADELVLQHHAFPRDRTAGENSDHADFQHVMLLAAKRQDVRERLRLFEEAEIRVDTLQSDAVALYNFALHDCLSDNVGTLSDPQPLAMLDVGTRATNLVICSAHGIWFRTLRFGGVDFTEAILRPFNLTYEQAEQVKRQPVRARRLNRLYGELDTVLSRFTAETQRSMASYEKDHRGPGVAKVWGCGGGFQVHGLLRQLSS